MAPLMMGLHMSVCSLEFAIYYGHQQCPLCCHSVIEGCLVQGIPLIWNQGNLSIAKQFILEPTYLQDPVLLFAERVRATSVILLLGVGSFLCYKIFHHLRHRLKKKCSCDSKLLKTLKLSKWISDELLTKDVSSDNECIEEKYFGPEYLKDSDAQSHISDTTQSSDTDCNSGSWGDRESTSDSLQLSDSEEEIMGISASNHSIPVFFSKTNGVFFNGNPKSNQHNDENQWGAEHSLSNPCSNYENSFYPTQLKPKCSPKRKICRSNRGEENLYLYNSKNCDYFDESYKERFLEEGDLDSSQSWDFQGIDPDTLSRSDSFSFDGNTQAQETCSLRANFSPDSLKERYLKAETYFFNKEKCLTGVKVGYLGFESGENSGVHSDSHVLHMQRDISSADSLSSVSDQLFLSNRYIKRYLRDVSVDSETSDFSLDPQASELGHETVDQLEQLQNQLHEVKQAVLELDADIVELKVYENPPKHSWQLSAVSPSDVDQTSWSENTKSGFGDVMYCRKAKMCHKELVNPQLLSKEDNIESKKVHADECSDSVRTNISNSSLPWDTSIVKVPPSSIKQENPNSLKEDVTYPINFKVKNKTDNLDSGSDFGNSLESDCGEVSDNGDPCSLEWDPMCLPECPISLDEDVPSSSSQYAKEDAANNDVSISESTTGNLRMKQRRRSLSVPSDLCAHCTTNEQNLSSTLSRSMTIPCCKSRLKKTEKNNLVAIETGSVNATNFTLETPHIRYIGSSEESGFQDVKEENKMQRSAMSCDSSSDCLASNTQNKNFSVYREDSNGNCLLIDESSTVNTTDMTKRSINRDSAYSEENSFLDNNLIKNIGPKQNLIEYSLEESKLKLNDRLEKGYAELENCGFTSVRKIRSDDNYGTIRASLFQVLCQGLPVLKLRNNADCIFQKLRTWSEGLYPWLSKWSFANRLPYAGNAYLQGFYECLHSLQKIEEELKHHTDKENYLTTVLNNNSELDAHLMEAIKILIMSAAIEFYESFDANNVVPIFVMVLFARDSSSSLQEFMFNHLNNIGNSMELEQVEMHLLGYSLSVTLTVISPLHYGTEEFIIHYPDKEFGNPPEVTLIAKDNRYNVLLR